MPCIGLNPLNSYNFIRWFSTTDVVLGDLGTVLDNCSGTITKLPNNIIEKNLCYYPKFVLGKQVSFYANLDTPATDVDFSDWRIRLYDQFGTNSGFADIVPTQDNVTGGFNWYFSLTPSGITANRKYRFVIYLNATTNVKYVSNFFEVVPAADEDKYCYLSYRHSNNIWNFNYATLTSFRNRVFVDMNDVEDQPEIELTQYPEVTTGIVRNEKTYTKEVRTLETFFFDFEADRAMLALSGHNDILINTNQMEVKEPFQSVPHRGMSIKKGNISFYNQAVSEINLTGYLT